MNTNKIMEALERIRQMRIPAHAYNDYRRGWMDGVDACKEEAREALAELDKAPKVLTNEEAGRITDYVYLNGVDGVPKNEIAMAKAGFNFGLRYARDNGYLAPSAGLTVEEIVRVVMKWYDSPIDYNGSDEEQLRTLFTDAINAKQKP